MSKVLVLSPHPDDEALGCGGMLARHALAGDEIYVIFLTSGEHGSRLLPPVETAALHNPEGGEFAEAFVEVRQPVIRRTDGDVTTARVVSSQTLEHQPPMTEHDPNAGVCKT